MIHGCQVTEDGKMNSGAQQILRQWNTVKSSTIVHSFEPEECLPPGPSQDVAVASGDTATPTSTHMLTVVGDDDDNVKAACRQGERVTERPLYLSIFLWTY